MNIAVVWVRLVVVDKSSLRNTCEALEDVDKDCLYRAHDKLLPFKKDIEKHPKECFRTLFDAEYDLLLVV